MNPIDYYILTGLVANVAIGYATGFIRQVASIVGLIVGVFLAGRFYNEVAKLFHNPDGGGIIADPNWARIAAFALIVIVCSVAAGILGHFLRVAVYWAFLGMIDHLLGAAVGALHSVVLALGLIIASTVFPVPGLSDALKDSKVAEWLGPFVPAVQALLPHDFDSFRRMIGWGPQ